MEYDLCVQLILFKYFTCYTHIIFFDRKNKCGTFKNHIHSIFELEKGHIKNTSMYKKLRDYSSNVTLNISHLKDIHELKVEISIFILNKYTLHAEHYKQGSQLNDIYTQTRINPLALPVHTQHYRKSRQILDFMMSSDIFEIEEFKISLCNNTSFNNLVTDPNFNTLFTHARLLYYAENHKRPFLEQTLVYQDLHTKCLTIEKSCEFMQTFCIQQNINPKILTDNIITLMDKKHKTKNTLLLQGHKTARNIIINSIKKCAKLYDTPLIADKKFSFVNTLNKQLIVLNEPIINKNSYPILKTILKGEETIIYVSKIKSFILKQTPVIISTDNITLGPNTNKILDCCIHKYVNLKRTDYPPERDLHPAWISKFSETYSSPNEPEIAFSPSMYLKKYKYI